MLRKKADYRKSHGSEFLRLQEYQQSLVDRMWNQCKRLMLQGANQIGKTLIGAALVDSWARGVQAWDGRQSIFGGRPTTGRVICTDLEHHADQVLVPKLKEMIPAGAYTTSRNNRGTEAFWRFNNGSSFDLMTIKQDTQSHESSTLDWVWCDEPLPWDKFSANCRGLLRSHGIFLLTMTAVGRESWILDNFALKTEPIYGCVTRVPMQANKYLSEEAIAQFIKDCPENEIEARVNGGWLHLTGLVVKNFVPDTHLIEPFKLPAHWVVVPFIDIHLNKPQAISFFAYDPMGREYQIDEIWEHLSPEGIADAIIEKKRENNWKILEVGIDPLAKGDSAYIRNRCGEVEDSYTIIERILGTEGIELFAASKDKESGIRNIDAALKGVNGQPTLYFFRGKTDMAVKQLQRWIYGEDEKPLKKEDDFPENLYRSTLLGSEYTFDLSREEPSIRQPDAFEKMMFSQSCLPSENNWMAS